MLACGNLPGCCSDPWINTPKLYVLSAPPRGSRRTTRASPKASRKSRSRQGIDAVPMFERTLAARSFEWGCVARAMSRQSSRPGAAWRPKRSSISSLNGRRYGSMVMRSSPSCARCSASAMRRTPRSSEALASSAKRGDAVGGAAQSDAYSSDFSMLDETVARARQGGMAESLLVPFEAIAASEQMQIERADSLFAAMDAEPGESIPIWHVRHLLRAGRIGQAISLIDRQLEGVSSRAVLALCVARLALGRRSAMEVARGRREAGFDLRSHGPASAARWSCRRVAVAPRGDWRISRPVRARRNPDRRAFAQPHRT